MQSFSLNLNVVLFFKGTRSSSKGNRSSRLIFHQVWDYYTHFIWRSITSESLKHQGILVRTCSDDTSFSAPSPALVQGACGSALSLSSVCQISQGLLCEAVTHQFREAMCLWNLQQKDLKAIFRYFFSPHFSLWFIEIVFPSRKAGKIQHTVKFLRHFLLLVLSTQTTFQTWTGDWLAEYKDWQCVSWTSRTW